MEPPSVFSSRVKTSVSLEIKIIYFTAEFEGDRNLKLFGKKLKAGSSNSKGTSEFIKKKNNTNQSTT